MRVKRTQLRFKKDEGGMLAENFPPFFFLAFRSVFKRRVFRGFVYILMLTTDLYQFQGKSQFKVKAQHRARNPLCSLTQSM